jgi:hypothetical protein
MLVPLTKHGTQRRHFHCFTIALDRAVGSERGDEFGSSPVVVHVLGQ